MSLTYIIFNHWTKQRANETWVNLLKQMLSIDDVHAHVRMQEVFMSTQGIVAMTLETLAYVQEQPHQSHHQMHGYNQYGYNNMNVHAQRYQYYFDIGRQLYGPNIFKENILEVRFIIEIILLN